MLVALWAACAGLIQAAPLQRSLADGLVYFRVHTLPADLPSDQALQKRACVLDLRYTTSDAAGATVLNGWLKFHSAPRTPIFALVNGGTANVVADALRENDSLPGLLTVGIAGQNFEPDIAVTATAKDERKAYDALEHGATIAALTTDNPQKQRNDEASLAHDRPQDAPTDPDDLAEPEKPAAKSAPLIDAVLQRAIQVYRGLKAMKTVAEQPAKH